MRVLQVIPCFHPFRGGPFRVVNDISKELIKRGHEVVIYTSAVDETSSGSTVEDYLNGMEVHFFQNISTIISERSKLLVTPGLIQAAKEGLHAFDVIHVHEYRTFQNVVIHHYAKKYGVPYVLQAHGSIPRMGKQSLKWIYDTLFGYRLLRDAAKVIALSRVEAEQYKAMGVSEEKIAIIPNGIDLSEYGDLPPKGLFKKKFNVDDDEKIVLYLGRIHRIKGIDILVKAFANVIRKLEDVRLVVVGPDDGYLGEIEALTRALKIENDVLILGPLYDKDKLEAYVDADVYVLPSRYETFPMSVLEAIACGTPIILTKNCGIAEYFRDKGGLIVKPDSEHFGKALLQMLLENERRNVFRKNCKTVIEKFNISNTISKLKEVYYKVVNDLRYP